MAQVVACLDQPSTYRDHRSEVGLSEPLLDDCSLSQLDRETERRLLVQSSTLYVGNLSFYTTEAQIYDCTLSRVTFYYLDGVQCFRLVPGQRREGGSRGSFCLTIVWC